MTIIVPDILHTAYLGMLNYLMVCVTSFLEQGSRINIFMKIWAMMPLYPGFGQFNKQNFQVTEWSGKEMSVLWGQIFPVFPTTL
jgi:hypothetical protein